jgi:hypothetical protein
MTTEAQAEAIRALYRQLFPLVAAELDASVVLTVLCGLLVQVARGADVPDGQVLVNVAKTLDIEVNIVDATPMGAPS